MEVNFIMECFSRDVISKYHHKRNWFRIKRSLHCARFCFKSLAGHSNRSVARLPFHMDAKEIDPA